MSPGPAVALDPMYAEQEQYVDIPACTRLHQKRFLDVLGLSN
jgi:hypothetical protein